MRLCRNHWLAWLVLTLFMLASSRSALALVPTSYSGTMNKAVGSIVQHKTGKWGLTPSDPRVVATTAGISAGLTTVAGVVLAGGVAAVSWPALLGAAAINAVTGGLILLAVDAAAKWWFKDDGTIAFQEGADVENLPAGSPILVWCNYGVCATTIAQACDSIASSTVQNGGVTYIRSWSYDYPTSQCIAYDTPASGGPRVAVGVTNFTQRSGCAGIGLEPVDGMCPPSNFPEVGTILFSDPGAAVDALPQEMAEKPVSSEMLAAAVNTAWRGKLVSSDSIPWSATDPVTAQDVDEWRSANPSLVPTVQDFIGPATGSGGQVDVSPATATGGSGSPTTGTTAPPTSGTGQDVDLGPDPNLGPPGLEAIPSASQILSPLLNLMPDLRSFVVPAHTSECPSGSFAVFDQTYVFNAHCNLIESNRALIEAAMLLVWAISSVLIVLRA